MGTFSIHGKVLIYLIKIKKIKFRWDQMPRIQIKIEKQETNFSQKKRHRDNSTCK